MHHVKRHDVPSVHPLAGGELVMSRWPIRIRREHFAESIVDRYGLYEPSDSPIESELRIERKIRMIGLACMNVVAERFRARPASAWVDLPRPAGNPSMVNGYV